MNAKAKAGLSALGIAALILVAWFAFRDRSVPTISVDVDSDATSPAIDDASAAAPTLVGSGRPGPSPAVGAPAAGETPGASVEAPVEQESRTVSGVVMVSGRPVSGGSILVRHPHGRVLSGSMARREPIPIEPDGTFRIEGVRWTGLTLLVFVNGMQPRTVSVISRENQRVEITLGSGSIWGVAHGPFGHPVAAAQIRLSMSGMALQMFLRTDADGSYEFRDLPAGAVVLVGRVAPKTPSSAHNIRSYRITLEEGERRRLDLGGPLEDARWSGVVRYVDGVSFERAGNVFLESHDGETRMYVSFDAEGRFSENVPPGAYRMEFVLPGIPGLPGMLSGMRLVQTSQELVVGGQDLLEDLVFPGTRVTGRLGGYEAGGLQTLSFRREEAADPSSEPPPLESLVGSATRGPITVRVAEDGTYLVDGLLPGTHRITGSPRVLRGTVDNTVSLEVQIGRSHIPLQLELDE